MDFPVILKSLPLIDMMKRAGGPRTDWEDYLSNRPGSTYWSRQGYATDTSRYNVPAIHVNSWLDYGAEQTLFLFNVFKRNAVSRIARDNQFVIVSPTTHCGSERAGEHTLVGDVDVGDARLDYWKIYLDWFDNWLKEEKNGVVKETPRFQYYTMGLNKWQSAETWPPAGAKMTALYLTSRGNANSVFGDGKLTLERPGSEDMPDAFTYDPDNPVPVNGDGCC